MRFPRRFSLIRAALAALASCYLSCAPAEPSSSPEGELPDGQVPVNGGAGATAVVGFAAPLTVATGCYGSSGLQPLAPSPMIGLCPAHRNQSPAVGAQSSSKPSGWTS